MNAKSVLRERLRKRTKVLTAITASHVKTDSAEHIAIAEHQYNESAERLEEAYNFFVRSGNLSTSAAVLPPQSPQQDVRKDGDDSASDDIEGSNDHAKLFSSNEFTHSNEDSWVLFEYMPPIRESHEAGNVPIFIPSFFQRKSGFREKISDTVLDEELSYSTSVELSKRNRIKMSHRILSENGVKPNSNYWAWKNGIICSVVEKNVEKLVPPDVDYGMLDDQFQPQFYDAYFEVPQRADGVYRIAINIAAIKFKHHSLFSPEHAIVSQLESAFEKHEWLLEQLLHLEQEIAIQRNNVKKMEGDEKRIVALTELGILRTNRDALFGEHSKCSTLLLGLWQRLGDIRRQQQFISTPHVLSVQPITINEADVTSGLERDIADEIDELQTLHELTSRNENLDTDRLSVFDSNAARSAIYDRMRHYARLDTTPKNRFTLHRRKQTVTPTANCPRHEQKRRQHVSNTKYYIRLSYNEKFVLRTSTKLLNQDFSVSWQELYTLQVEHYPHNIQVEIFEISFSSLQAHCMAKVYATIEEDAVLRLYEFSFQRSISVKRSTFSTETSDMNRNKNLLVTSGHLFCNVVLQGDEKTTVFLESEASNTKFPPLDAVGQIGSAGVLDSFQLLKWANSFDVKQLSTQHAASITAIKNLESSIRTQNVLRAVDDRLTRLESSDTTALSDYDPIEDNPRFRLLKLRAAYIPTFRHYRMVPLSKKEYTQHLIEKLYQRRRIEKKPERIDELEAFQAKTSDAIISMRDEVIRRAYASQNRRILEDLVIEEQVPNISSLGFSMLSITRPRRPLRPRRKERRRITAHTARGSHAPQVKLIITVLRATNVPIRRSNPNETRRNLNIFGSSFIPQQDESMSSRAFESHQVNPFVEIMFQNETTRTFVAEGPHPTWNQELQLPFRCPDVEEAGIPLSSMESNRDVIYLNLFDQVILDLLEDERDRQSTIYQRLERRWLGSLKIPFSTLFLNSKIEGIFQLEVPPVLLGYEHETRSWGFHSATPNTPAPTTTYLSLFLTLEPALQLPDVVREKCDSLEPPSLLNEGQQWERDFLAKFPRRKLKVFAMDMTGKWVFVSRYIHPIIPPVELITASLEVTCEQVARFISLIPTVSDSVIFPGICDIWSTSEQFMRSLVGDEEEHAILLCNYFLHLGKSAWLILGDAIPEGATAYVLTQENNGEYWVWNATTGRHYTTTDFYSPLQSVGCLIGPRNIWANVQKESHPSRMSFQLSRTQYWKPLLKQAPLNWYTVQPDVLEYAATNTQLIEQLQYRLETSLRENVMRWRRRHRTIWNRHCSQMLRKILPRFESHYVNRQQTSFAEDAPELQEILGSYKMTGFPLRLSAFVDIASVLETVRATGVHTTLERDAEFALALHIHPYPCNVLAIWIYIATLIRL